EEIGRNLVLVQLVANGLAGRKASTGLFLSSADDSSTYSGGGLFHSTAIGEDGATAQLQFAVTSLQLESEGIIVDQDRQRWLAKYIQPFAKSGNRELSAFGGFEGDDLDVEQDGVLSQEDRLRSLNFGLSANWRGGDRSGLLSVETELGMNAAGDTDQVDALGQNNFAIWRVQAAHTTRLGESWTWRTDGYAQYSSDELASVKQFKVGGGRIGRGFEAAAASGDSGGGMKLDLRRPIGENLPWFGAAQFYAYYDLGAAWRNDRPGRESAASAGLGVSAQSEHFAAYFEVAKPLTHPDADGRKDAGVFAELTYRF
ncbi:MAG TPA: ShlB/FhaC/HecB family hemolysin secretion/activation protein, partial [Woeseiaceae bacterium]|nr:ShlB/FhaC/HecB family hemolysin secretion/activation protein [Woeseiaceae bacterium]